MELGLKRFVKEFEKKQSWRTEWTRVLKWFRLKIINEYCFSKGADGAQVRDRPSVSPPVSRREEVCGAEVGD